MSKLLAKTLKYIAHNLENEEDFEEQSDNRHHEQYKPQYPYEDLTTDRLYSNSPVETQYAYDGYYSETAGPISSVSMMGNSHQTSEVILMEPSQFEDVLRAVSAVRMQKLVVLNLSKIDNEEAQRAVDFLSGGIYMIDGDFEKVNDFIFLFIPYCIKLSSQLRTDSLMNEELQQPNSLYA
ncbi:hypothetical protein C7271_02045 [filamentous cyanobacterium CCP5]|nr:hypothetical protein C7271_02045 [filamentous cyanobacterium CCP5]